MSAEPLTVISLPEVAAPAAARRAADLTEHRGTRRVVFTPKYGSGPVEVDIRYLWCGAPHAPTVIVQGGISADRDVCAGRERVGGWWQDLVGQGAAIDLLACRVLSIDWIVPAELEGVPSVSSEDQAAALAVLVDELGIGRVQAFVGSSYGAMVGLAFAANHADKVKSLVLLAGAHRPHPLATAQRSVQRGIVRLGLATGCTDEALALARQLAMTTYRGSEEFSRRFAAGPELREGRFHFPVEDYLEHAGRRFVERFDASRFLALSESIDLHDIAPERIHATTTLVGFPSDRLVPLADLCELQRRLGGTATLEVVDSPYGHDAFLKETVQLAPVLRHALNDCHGDR
ncbi:homoserine O-succinyltransferase MetX [Luteibacter sp. UNCMF366Tsu5.1]|uniref:homoserine O-succinyltransferase MetX n=1 Tax=Luteibacter sp. UNCMF366Tsu5.1 TaxID=1502758 RepID=UPI000908F33B|nr:homoserine O-succinyltransferase [Luteibacter sp. UNCMF366Tsu5.1]SFW39229.1 homoserine O-acetyltransferase [Luteibacter sp. UNCMF366Tsu5.1]